MKSASAAHRDVLPLRRQLVVRRAACARPRRRCRTPGSVRRQLIAERVELAVLGVGQRDREARPRRSALASLPAGAFHTPRVRVGAGVDAGDEAARRERRAARPPAADRATRTHGKIERRVDARRRRSWPAQRRRPPSRPFRSRAQSTIRNARRSRQCCCSVCDRRGVGQAGHAHDVEQVDAVGDRCRDRSARAARCGTRASAGPSTVPSSPGVVGVEVDGGVARRRGARPPRR